ncbi:hypothetical protein GCM10022221_02010 [Actinocorallia aurea]
MNAHVNRPSALVAATALLGGASLIGLGVVLVGWPSDTIPELKGSEHVALGFLAAGLALLIPPLLALGRRGSRATAIAAGAVAVGHVLLAVGSTASNLHDEDYPWFPAVAVPANAALLFGLLTMAVTLWRAGFPRPYALGLGFLWFLLIPLSQFGGPALAGLFWILLLRALYTAPSRAVRVAA